MKYTFDQDLNRLHPGDKEAIVLADKLSADLIILDEKEARQRDPTWGQVYFLGIGGLLKQFYWQMFLVIFKVFIGGKNNKIFKVGEGANKEVYC